MTETDVDIVIVGGGPAGLQAALVLSRTQKQIIVFDAPTPPHEEELKQLRIQVHRGNITKIHRRPPVFSSTSV